MSYPYKCIAALNKIIIKSDLKAIEKKFIIKEDPIKVKEYLKLFNKLKDQHRIQDSEKKNIDYWGKKTFKEFKDFVDSLVSKKSTRQLKKDIHLKPVNIEGAKLVTENEDWFMYEITTYKAAKFLGSRNWCIVRKQEDWDEYHGWYYVANAKGEDVLYNETCFYFFIAKNNRFAEEWRKLALQVDYDGELSFWNELDEEYSPDLYFFRHGAREHLNLPKDYKNYIKYPEQCPDIVLRDKDLDDE